jgi:PAS domain S-box-containing protein
VTGTVGLPPLPAAHAAAPATDGAYVAMPIVRRFMNFERALLDRVSAAVIATDLSGQILYANAHVEWLYGLPASEIVGRSSIELGGVLLGREVAREIAAALRRGETWEGEFTVERRDGSRVEVRAIDSGLHDDHGSLVGVISIVTDATEQRAVIDRLSQQHQALEFVLKVSDELSSALDYEEGLRRLARLVVPTMGDLCLIDVVEDGTIRRAAAAHADPSKEALVNALAERYPPNTPGDHPVSRVLATGRPEAAGEMPEAFLQAITGDDEHLRIVHALEFTSYMCVPLPGRDRMLGTLTVVSAGSGRRFDGHDIAVLEDLGRRTGLMLDNARLFSDRARVARALQASLLPPSLPEIPGLEVATRYRAAGEGNEIGGDFYDIFDAGYRTWVAVVGDVCGTGPEAAALTGLVRHTIRAAALRERKPVGLLRAVNTVLLNSDLHPEAFCTLCIATIRISEGVARLNVASGGHPPPVLLQAGGPPTWLDCRGTIIGITPELHLQSTTVSLAPGDTLLLYTDGLIEARSPSGAFFGESGLDEVLAGLDGPPEGVVAALLESARAFTAGRLTDDVALMALALSPSS